MNTLDYLILAMLLTAVLRGIEIGMIRQTASSIGVGIGIALGLFTQSFLVGQMHTPSSKTVMALAVMMIFVAIFSMGGSLFGDMIRGHVDNSKRKKLIDYIDRGVGAVVGGAMLIVMVWLGAAVFANTPDKNIQSQLNGSRITAKITEIMPKVPSSVAKIGHLLNPNAFPDVFTGLEPKIDTSLPLPSVGNFDQAVEMTRESVVKVEGVGCGGITQGTGFVIGIDLVMTNAHVIAGVKKPIIVDGNGQHTARAILFDARLDVAILASSNLSGLPLKLNTDKVDVGSAALAMGFPGGGDFKLSPANVLERFSATGKDIYNQADVEREIYSINADIQHGNSGGPLVNKGGEVIGLIFAESTTNGQVGYALVSGAVKEAVNTSNSQQPSVATGSCTE